MSASTIFACIPALALLWASIDLQAQVYCQTYGVVNVDTCSSIVELDRRPTGALASGTYVLLHRSQGPVEDSSRAAGVMMLCRLDTINDRRLYLHEDIRQVCAPEAKLQLVIPLRSKDLAAHDTVRCIPWNGRHGGVIAIVDSVVDLQHKRIDASGCGFRGGYNVFSTADTTTGAPPEWYLRGESHATLVDASSHRNGTPRNGGGAGGAMSGYGGDGGGTSSAFLPTQPGGTSRNGVLHQRTVFGAGGGAGHRNDLNTSSGGRGGGLIVIVADSIIADTSTYLSVAGSPGNSARYDGAGGGGAGGTVVLSGPGRLTNGTLDLRGGDGGSVVAGLFTSGPGGGGAGGTLVTSGLRPTSTMLGEGGKAGYILDSGQHANQHGAQDGNNGIIIDQKETLLPRTMRRALPLQLQARDTIVPYGSTATIYVKAEGLISWNTADIVPLVGDGSIVETPTITQARWFVCRVITPSGCIQVDSIRIKPGLESVSLVVEADYARARPGDTIDVFIRMTLSAPLDRQVQGVAVVSSYAGVAQALRGTFNDEHRTSTRVPFIIAPGATSTFRRERFAIVLGDSVATQLRVDSVSLERPTLQVRRRHGRISLDDLCVAGGRTRLFNPHTPTFKIEGRRITIHAEQVALVDILGRYVPCTISHHSDATIVQLPQHVRGALFIIMEHQGHAVTTPFWLD